MAITFVGMVYRGLTTFLPKFLGSRLADEASTATAVGGALTTLALIAGLGGMYVAGRWVDRIGAGPVFLAGTVLQAPMLVLLGAAIDPALVPLAMGVAFFHFMTQPAGNYLVAAPYAIPSARSGIRALLLHVVRRRLCRRGDRRLDQRAREPVAGLPLVGAATDSRGSRGALALVGRAPTGRNGG